MPSCRRCALVSIKTQPAAPRLVQAKEILAPAPNLSEPKTPLRATRHGATSTLSFSAGTIPALRRRCAPTVGAWLGSECLTSSAPAPATRRLQPRPAPSMSACSQRPSYRSPSKQKPAPISNWLPVLRTGRCLRADDVDMLAQPALREPASLRSDRGQLASPANGRTTAHHQSPTARSRRGRSLINALASPALPLQA